MICAVREKTGGAGHPLKEHRGPFDHKIAATEGLTGRQDRTRSPFNYLFALFRNSPFVGLEFPPVGLAASCLDSSKFTSPMPPLKSSNTGTDASRRKELA